MQRIISLLILLVASTGLANPRTDDENTKTPVEETTTCQQLYQQLGLAGEVDYTGFEQACIGYEQIRQKAKDMLVLVDFTKASTEERLYVIDMEARQVLFRSHVAHGKNSGENYARYFSNKNGSSKSSLGFYLTAETYTGRAGYSLRINGLENGINDNASARGVVIHGAKYANPEFAASAGRLGRSQGCPALPEALSRPIIETIKGGAVLYIYAADQSYFSQSRFLSPLRSLASV
ncbi:murein L,D-transpeptidase catalytic domain family protein [Alistipes sp. OttesenSCG-928-L06]|nr:murein L,D-transpeptidase catalytic domain family protein [Alistipes sp. OttesenSCG-928-L06]